MTWRDRMQQYVGGVVVGLGVGTGLLLFVVVIAGAAVIVERIAEGL